MCPLSYLLIFSFMIVSPVNNFPPSYPWYKRLGANITYFLSQIPLSPRKNLLMRRDISVLWETIEEWDILLWGMFYHLSAVSIDGAFTHAMSYVGKGRCIHAYGHGVAHIWLRKVCRIYDTILILRPKWENPEQISQYRQFLIAQIGKPYDFYFGLPDKNETFFCTELINEALLSVWYQTWLRSVKKASDTIDKILDETIRVHRILKPTEMIQGNFEIIWYSSSVEYSDNSWLVRWWKINTLIL